jgi:hypothetical protein
LDVANGGTGVASLTANKVLVGNGTTTVLQPTNLHWDDANARLGISSSVPTSKLDIFKTTQGNTSDDMIGLIYDANWNLKIRQQHVANSHIQYDISQRWNATEIHMITLKGGYVGIGTTNPDQNLHISSTNVETNMKFENTSTNGKIYEIISGGSGGTFEGGRFGIYCRTDAIEMLTMTSKTSLTAGGLTGRGVGFPHAGFWFDRGWADYPCITVTNTNKTGNTNQAQLRLHGVNASYASYPSAGGADFSCSMYIDGTYQSASDRRFKRNITSIANALTKVLAMDGKRYQIINSQGEIITNTSANNYKFGFIAQDIQDANLDEIYLHYPNEDDGTEGYNKAFSLDYDSISALLVNALKEQQEQINSLRARLDMLESKSSDP